MLRKQTDQERVTKSYTLWVRSAIILITQYYRKHKINEPKILIKMQRAQSQLFPLTLK
jgi:hypothetical protein